MSPTDETVSYFPLQDRLHTPSVVPLNRRIKCSLQIEHAGRHPLLRIAASEAQPISNKSGFRGANEVSASLALLPTTPSGMEYIMGHAAPDSNDTAIYRTYARTERMSWEF